MNRVLQAPVMLLGNVPALIIGLVPNVTNVKLDGPKQIAINVQLVGLGIIVTNVIQDIMDSHIAQVSKRNVHCRFCTVPTLYVIFFLSDELRKSTISDFPKQTNFGHILITFFFHPLIDPQFDIVFQPAA